MKVTHMRYATVQGEALYAIIKDEHRELTVDVADHTPKALLDVAREMREKVARDLKRIEFIEAGVASMVGGAALGVTATLDGGTQLTGQT